MILIINSDLKPMVLYNTTTTTILQILESNEKLKTVFLDSFNKHHPLLPTILGIEFIY